MELWHVYLAGILVLPVLQTVLSRLRHRWPGLVLPFALSLFTLVVVVLVVALAPGSEYNLMLERDKLGAPLPNQPMAVMTQEDALLFAVVPLALLGGPAVLLWLIYFDERRRRKRASALPLLPTCQQGAHR